MGGSKCELYFPQRPTNTIKYGEFTVTMRSIMHLEGSDAVSLSLAIQVGDVCSRARVQASAFAERNKRAPRRAVRFPRLAGQGHTIERDECAAIAQIS
jgi:hypothetical protein